MNMTLRLAEHKDLEAVVAIYNSTIASRMVTADTEPVTPEDRMEWFWDIQSHARSMLPRTKTETSAAWISFETFYGRPAYNKTAEVSIYIDEACRGKGIGSYLLQEALRIAPNLGIRSLMAFIFGHNKPSLKLFEKHGFAEWGLFPGIAEMDGKRYDLKILGRELS